MLNGSHVSSKRAAVHWFSIVRCEPAGRLVVASRRHGCMQPTSDRSRSGCIFLEAVLRCFMGTRLPLDGPQYWRDRAEEISALAYRVRDEHVRQSLFEIVRDYEAIAQRELQRRDVTQKQEAQPEANSRHKVERSASGGFIAFWQNKAIYENGHVRKFPTAEAAHSFLARCDTAGKIIHEA